MPAVTIEQLRHRMAWTFGEAAAVWGYPASFFKSLYERGEVVAFRPDGRKRVKLSADSIQAYFERNRVEPAKPVTPKLTARQRADMDPRVLAVRAAQGL